MQIADKYSPQEIESKWYDYWMEHRLFHSEPDEREPYTIVIPPPNVTGMLHMGHMLNNTLQDVLVRRARMQGKNACWVPGMDHASIATEAKVVAMLHEKGIEKSSLSREEFLEYAWEWKEKYGGMILSTWLDRPLSVAGRLAVKNGNGIEGRLVNIDRDLCVIPNVAIHMNREMNKGVEYNPQVDLLPLLADVSFDEYDAHTTYDAQTASENAEEQPETVEKPTLVALAAEAAGVDAETILGEDLFLYTRQEGKMIGAKGEFVLSPRLDDLQSAFALTKAFTESTPAEYINLCAVFDNEEVGSGTRQGADSTFLEDTLQRITEGLQEGHSTYLRWVADSFLISADNAHAVHPNHPEKADPANRPYLNGGIVIKYHGGQKYTTDGISAAKMKDYCERAKVPYQTYANRSDIAGGSTLGNISTAHVSVSSVDIGLPQLAMHSAVETAGMKDTEYAVRALKEFWGE